MAPSSRLAASSKPNVAYLELNFAALLKKQTILPSFAYAGIPYQVFGQRSGALALTIAWSRLAMARSFPFIAAIAASTSRSPSALFLFARSSAFSSWARALIAARSSAVNPLDFLSAVFFSAIVQLLDADQIARGIAERAVADPVRLVGRLLDDFCVAGLQAVEGALEILGGEVDARVGPLRHHLGDRAALLVGDARGGARRVQDDRRAGLVGRADGDPVHPGVLDVVANLEPEGVAVEGHGGLRVLVWEEACVNGDVHRRKASAPRRPALLDS